MAHGVPTLTRVRRDKRRSLWVVAVTFAVLAPFIAMSVSAEAGLSAGASGTTTTTRPTTTTTFPMNPTRVTYNVPAGIAKDCSTDVTPALMAWFKSVPDNSVLLFGAGACYEIENVLLIASRRRLTFDGNGATFMAKTDGASQTPPAGLTGWPRRRAHWWVLGSTDITVTNMTIIGANPYVGRVDAQFNPNYERQAGLVVDGSTGVTLANARISKVWGDFVLLDGNSRSVTIRNNKMMTSGRQGIAIVRASKVLVDGNVLTDVRWGMFDLEPNSSSTVLDDIRIVNNLTGSSRWMWFASWGLSTSVRNIVVEHNVSLGLSRTLVFVRNDRPDLGRRGPFSFAYNDFRLGTGELAAFELWGAQQVTVHDNIVRTAKDTKPTMVHAWGSDQLQVHHNDFTGAAMILDQGDTPTWCEADNKPAALSQNKPC
jgi:hypothetical protein